MEASHVLFIAVWTIIHDIFYSNQEYDVLKLLKNPICCIVLLIKHRGTQSPFLKSMSLHRIPVNLHSNLQWEAKSRDFLWGTNSDMHYLVFMSGFAVIREEKKTLFQINVFHKRRH